MIPVEHADDRCRGVGYNGPPKKGERDLDGFEEQCIFPSTRADYTAEELEDEWQGLRNQFGYGPRQFG